MLPSAALGDLMDVGTRARSILSAEAVIGGSRYEDDMKIFGKRFCRDK
jgi:hypothetical protein